MKIKSQKDFWSGLLFLLTGLAFAAAATRYRLGSSAQPGPGFFPLGLGLLLALLGGGILFKALTLESSGGDPIGAVAWKPLLSIVAAVAAFGWLLPRLGLVGSLPVLVVMASVAGSDFRWRGALISSVVLTAGSWLIFVKGLKLTIPVWPVFFNI